jgi:hypothetical protein
MNRIPGQSAEVVTGPGCHVRVPGHLVRPGLRAGSITGGPHRPATTGRPGAAGSWRHPCAPGPSRAPPAAAVPCRACAQRSGAQPCAACAWLRTAGSYCDVGWMRDEAWLLKVSVFEIQDSDGDATQMETAGCRQSGPWVDAEMVRTRAWRV